MAAFVSALCPSCAAPQIRAAQPATLKQGELLTIHGVGFGESGPHIVLFDDFEGGKPGSRVPWGGNSTAPVCQQHWRLSGAPLISPHTQ